MSMTHFAFITKFSFKICLHFIIKNITTKLKIEKNFIKIASSISQKIMTTGFSQMCRNHIFSTTVGKLSTEEVCCTCVTKNT